MQALQHSSLFVIVTSEHLYLLKCCLFVNHRCTHHCDCIAPAHIEPLRAARTPVHLSPFAQPTKKIGAKIPVVTVTCITERASALGFGSVALSQSIKVRAVPSQMKGKGFHLQFIKHNFIFVSSTLEINSSLDYLCLFIFKGSHFCHQGQIKPPNCALDNYF